MPKNIHDVHRMTYPQTDAQLGSDARFRNREDEDHHKESTPLKKLPLY